MLILSIITLQHINVLLIVIVSYVLIREYIIRRLEKQQPKKIVGVIDPSEVSDLLITDYLDCENRQNDLHSMKPTKFNNENELLKADRAYSAIARSIRADLDKVL